MSTTGRERWQREGIAEQQQGVSDIRPFDDLWIYLKRYAEKKPATAALVCLGVGFVLGWKLKPW